MSENVTRELLTTAFGELKVEQANPISQISAEYGLFDQTLTVTDSSASGTNTIVNNKFTCQTGTDAAGLASILSLLQLKYRPGQGALARFTSVFTTGVSDSRQVAGLITSENVFGFGFVNENFGIIHAFDGEVETQELTITTPAAGGENATITIDGVGITVPLTAGTVQHNAFEIALSLEAQVANYTFTSNNDNVIAQSVISGPQGSFAFSSATAVAAWVQENAGVDTTIDFIAQADWNEDTRINTGTEPEDILENLDPTLGNVYQIQYQYLGFGAIKFFVEDNDTGEFILVHMIKFTNTSAVPSVSNPTFRVGWLCRNLGNTTNLTTAGSSAAIFIEGVSRRDTKARAAFNDQLSVGTTLTNIMTFRNRSSFGGKVNRIPIFPVLMSASTQANKSAFFVILADPVFGGDLNFSYVDKASSVMETASDNVSVSDGDVIGVLTVVDGSSLILDLNSSDSQRTVLSPQSSLCIASQVSSGAAGDMQASLTWQEDV